MPVEYIFSLLPDAKAFWRAHYYINEPSQIPGLICVFSYTAFPYGPRFCPVWPPFCSLMLTA